jgi:hypothetical protein
LKNLVLGLALTAISVSAQAKTSQWKLVRKISGPAGFECGTPATLSIDTDGVSFAGEGGSPNVILDSVNQGKQCSRGQNGAPFGTLHCQENVLTEKGSNLSIDAFSCTSQLPIVSSCNTRADGPTQSIVVKGNELTVSILTGWTGPDEGVFSCLYQAE